MDTVWPKMSRGVAELSMHVRVDRELDAANLLPIMLDRAPAPDDELPRTGLQLDQERWLSPIYILGPQYGTRTTSILLFQRDGVSIDEYGHTPEQPSRSGKHHQIDFAAGEQTPEG